MNSKFCAVFLDPSDRSIENLSRWQTPPAWVRVLSPSSTDFQERWKSTLSEIRKQELDLLFVAKNYSLPQPLNIEAAQKLAATDEMIGWVQPINAWMDVFLGASTDPQSGSLSEPGIHKMLFLPFAANTVFYMKSKILIAFDAPNDVATEYVMQASYHVNRCGYRAVLAPNWKVSLESLPELPSLTGSVLNEVNQFRTHPNVQHTLLRMKDIHSPEHWLIDLSILGPSFNGAYHCAFGVIRALTDHTISESVKISIKASEEAVEFHQLKSRFPKFQYQAQINDEDFFSKVIVMNQPWFYSDFKNYVDKCLRIFYFVHDTIPWDCSYIRNHADSLDELYSLTARLADGLFFNSAFSQKQFFHRFPEAQKERTAATPLSASPEEYLFEGEISPPQHGSYILIFGSHLHRKYTAKTAQVLEPLTDKKTLVVLGKAHPQKPSTKIYKSGTLSNADIHGLIAHSDFVIYPSHYEGFGMAILESLAHDKFVAVRDYELNREVADLCAKYPRIILFRNDQHLAEIVSDYENRGQDALKERVYVSDKKPSVHTWNDTLAGMLDLISATEKLDPYGARSLERLSYLNYYIFRESERTS